jgi:hypothetical protein
LGKRTGFTGHSIANRFNGLPQWQAASVLVSIRFGMTTTFKVACWLIGTHSEIQIIIDASWATGIAKKLLGGTSKHFAQAATRPARTVI